MNEGRGEKLRATNFFFGAEQESHSFGRAQRYQSLAQAPAFRIFLKLKQVPRSSRLLATG